MHGFAFNRTSGGCIVVLHIATIDEDDEKLKIINYYSNNNGGVVTGQNDW